MTPVSPFVRKPPVKPGVNPFPKPKTPQKEYIPPSRSEPGYEYAEGLISLFRDFNEGKISEEEYFDMKKKLQESIEKSKKTKKPKKPKTPKITPEESRRRRTMDDGFFIPSTEDADFAEQMVAQEARIEAGHRKREEEAKINKPPPLKVKSRQEILENASLYQLLTEGGLSKVELFKFLDKRFPNSQGLLEAYNSMPSSPALFAEYVNKRLGRGAPMIPVFLLQKEFLVKLRQLRGQNLTPQGGKRLIHGYRLYVKRESYGNSEEYTNPNYSKHFPLYIRT